MTDEEMIAVISRRMSEECPWSDAKKVLNHYHWVDVVTHLWQDKQLRGALMNAYSNELLHAKTLARIDAALTRAEAYEEAR